jgi:hypothetical protein
MERRTSDMTEPEVLDSPDELAQLRAENERLRAMIAGKEPPAGRPRRHRRVGRWTAATVLLLIGCLLLPVSAIAVWARTAIFNTDRYVATVAPLARDPAIQNAVADRITNAVFTAIDIEGFAGRAIDGLVAQGAPPELALLRQPMVNGVRSFTRAQVYNVVSSDVFARAWEQANRVAHDALVSALKGTKGGTIEVSNGTVSVNLGAFIALVKPQLVAAGVPFAERIPAVNLSFPIVQSDKIPRIQRAAGLLDTLAVPLAIFALLLLAAAVWVAPRHRRMLAIAGFGTAAILLLSLGALAAGRSYYLGHLPQGSSPDAAAVVWDTLTRQFILRLQTVVVVGLVVALGAWVTGPGRLAQALRTGANRLIIWSRAGAARLGWRPGPVDRWVAAHVVALRVGALILIVAVYALWTMPTGTVVIWLTVALLILVAVVEFLRRGADLPVTPASAGADSPASTLPMVPDATPTHT